MNSSENEHEHALPHTNYQHIGAMTVYIMGHKHQASEGQMQPTEALYPVHRKIGVS